MRHHNSAAQGGVSNDCTPVFASGPHLITWFPHCYSRSILPLDTVRHAITSNAASNSCLQCICFQNLNREMGAGQGCLLWKVHEPPSPLKELLETPSFQINIHVANGFMAITTTKSAPFYQLTGNNELDNRRKALRGQPSTNMIPDERTHYTIIIQLNQMI